MSRYSSTKLNNKILFLNAEEKEILEQLNIIKLKLLQHDVIMRMKTVKDTDNVSNKMHLEKRKEILTVKLDIVQSKIGACNSRLVGNMTKKEEYKENIAKKRLILIELLKLYGI